MKPEKDPKTGKWLIQYRYTDWQGIRRKSTKRGFETKRAAEDWLRNFLVARQSEFNMNFEKFVELYYEDMKSRLREHTMMTKKYIIDLKILPFFGEKEISSITPSDIRKWQNEMIAKGYSQTYLRAINNQLTAIFNYAAKYYDLKNNPCKKAGSMGKSKADEMNFWTKEEFSTFVSALEEKRQSYVAFMVLFWTGMRLGEMLALTPADINFEAGTISITKSYQRLNRRDIITPPKTPKGKRVISAPEFLLDELRDYIGETNKFGGNGRLFPVTKYYIEREMHRGIKNSGVKSIRVHDIRHSHCALLFEMGATPLEAAERLGHERVETTLNTYAHLYPDKQRKLSVKLNDVYNEMEDGEK